MPSQVVGLGGDDACHRRAVAVRVGRRVAAGEDRRPRDKVAVEVGVRGVDAGVEDGDGRGARRCDGVACGLPADAGQRPLVGEHRIVGNGRDGASLVGVDAGDGGVGLEGGYCGGGGRARKDDGIHAKGGDVRIDSGIHGSEEVSSGRVRRPCGKGHDVRIGDGRLLRVRSRAGKLVDLRLCPGCQHAHEQHSRHHKPRLR